MEPSAADLPDHLITILERIRLGAASTRPELERATGLSRKIVAQRVEFLIDAGLVEDGALAPSTGGRMPRQLRLRHDAGRFLVAELNTTQAAVALTDLNGTFLDRRTAPTDTLSGPEEPLRVVEELFDAMLQASTDGAALWGVCIGVTLPVDRRTGRAAHMPFLPGWGDYPVAERFADRYGVPAWAENEVNLMALGELRAGLGRATDNFIFVKIGGGIGAGIVSGGALQRGAQGAAGEIGHVTVTDDATAPCWCGNTGCLMEEASGSSIARRGRELAESGASAYLADLFARGLEIDSSSVVDAAAVGDKEALSVVLRAGRLIGTAIADLVNVLNPASIFMGGTITTGSDILLAAIRRTIYERALPLTTRELNIEFSPLSEDAGLVGGAAMALDELFSPAVLRRWIEAGAPTRASAHGPR